VPSIGPLPSPEHLAFAGGDTGAIRTIAPPGLSLRRATDADLPFLADVYAAARADEMRLVPWSDDQKRAFLAWQFAAQHRHYQQYYASCEFLVVEKHTAEGALPIGRLYVDRRPVEIRIVEIVLLPAWRGAGLGTRLLTSIFAEADAARLPVTIHVECHNPALALYRRLGFEHVDSNGLYHLMRRTPAA
jgi:ribosomal protein S18 acetylase RimI-like enzyme